MATVPLRLTDSQGYLWDIYSTGYILGGTNDAFDGGFAIASYAPSTTVSEEESGREIVFQPTVVATDISLERKIYVPTGTTYGYARFLDSVTNTGSAVQKFTLSINTSLGSDGNESFILTSDGDNTLEATDSWIVTDDSPKGVIGGDSAVAHIFSIDGQRVATTATKSGANITYTYDLILNPGETKSVMHFGIQSSSNTDIQTVVNFIASGDPEIYAGLSTTELQQLIVQATVSTFAITSLSLMRVEGENISFTVTRSGDLSAAGSVDYTISGTGSTQTTADDFDLTSLTGTIQFAAGVQTRTVTIALEQDTTFEQDETFQVILLNGVNGAISTTASSAAGTIINDDPTLLTTNSDMYNGTTGEDFVGGDLGDDTMHGLDGNDRLSGGSGDDMLYGETGNDTLEGGLGDNFLYGGSGYDTLYATSKFGSTGELMTNSNQTVIASTGQSLSISLTVPEAIDGTTATIEGLINCSISESGADIARIFIVSNDEFIKEIDVSTLISTPSGLKFTTNIANLTRIDNTITVQVTATDTDSTALFVTQRVVTEKGTNELFGGSGNDKLISSLGSDYLNGGTGNDTASYEKAASSVSVNLSLLGMQDTLGGGVDTLMYIENLLGSNFNDTLTGNSGANKIIGGEGNDTIDGGAGNDTLIGGEGIDTLKYVTATAGVNVNLAITEVAQATYGSGLDFIVGFESLYGSNYDDTLIGNDGDNSIHGEDGNDIINGGAGHDILYGYDGEDTINGEDGNDYLGGFEGNDTIQGGAGNDSIDGGSGDDILKGGSGTDTLQYGSATSGVNINLGITIAQATGGSGSDTIGEFENLNGSYFNDTLTGSNGANSIRGGSGDDIIDGGAGNDRLMGDTGMDTLTYATAAGGIKINLALVTAQATGGSGSDTIGMFENLIGSYFQDTLTGSNATNTISGGAGNDTIDGGGGNDILIGGIGVDTLTYATATAAVTVNLGISTAQETGVSGSDTTSEFESLTGSNYNDTLTGSSVGNTLNGGGGNDWIDGGTGNDFLIGFTGSDTLYGGAGNDKLNGGAGNDRLSGGLGADNFIFNIALNATNNKDTIADFVAVDDTISLENAIFAKLTTTGALETVNFVANSTGTAVDAHDHIIYNTANGVLSYDADGSGAGVAIAFAVLGISTHPTISAADFVVI